MTTPAPVSPPAAAGGSASELLALVRDSDTVELKTVVADSQHRSAVDALGMDALDAEIRQVFFLDTEDLGLSARGIVLRTRRMQRDGGDSIVKLRPVVPRELPRGLRETSGFGVEVDAMPGGYVCSGTLKHRLSAARVRETVTGERRLRKLFTKDQRALLAEHGVRSSDLDGLTVLGPVFVLKLRFTPGAFGRKLVAEMWLYPDGSRLLELSTKCPPTEAFEVAAHTRAFLEERGVDLTVEQHTKTRHALTVLSAERRPGTD